MEIGIFKSNLLNSAIEFVAQVSVSPQQSNGGLVNNLTHKYK